MLSVPEAAAKSGLSEQRLRALVSSGRLPAVRVGRQWVVDEAALARHEPRMGRPLSERSCWALLGLAAGHPSGLDPSERHRARQRLRLLAESRAPASLLRSWLPNRARRQVYRASPRDIIDLRADPRLLLSGLSHPDSAISAADVAEGYVLESALAGLVADFLLIEAGDAMGNVVLHIPSRPLSRVSPLLLAADLSEHHHDREDARVAELVGSLWP